MDHRHFRAALADRYRIGRELGRGGMATVYLAEDLKHHRQVAIKVLSPELATAIGRDRFLQEIEIAARLTHPHILPLFDSGATDADLYYVMPYIAGETLRGRIAREKQLPLGDALRIAREIASGLGHAHRQGLVHRDIKPENVLLSDGIALVADFGIARVASTTGGSGRTTTGVVLGSPTYMAPEQAMGSADVDGRADLYALGCVLHEMLAGQPPFTGPLEGLPYQHASAEPLPVTDLRPSVPSGVAAAIAKALAKLPSDRYATVARFAEALSTAMTGAPTPVIARNPNGVAVPNNLPKERTRFIGREKELADCARLLGGTRLLTLTGSGGCGKTRLALKLVANLLEQFPDGVWFVDLAPLKDAERVTLTVATTLGVREEQSTPLIETLANHVSDKRALIVLDNCEHVIGAAVDLADALLTSSSQLKLIVTSREGLGIDGERPFSLRSLSVPPVSAGTDLRVIEASEAVQLFVDRAQVVEAGFEVSEMTAPEVAEICRRLDGIPLAIELAAARMHLLSVKEIRTRLDDRFRLLTGGSKTALPRHQTLRATIQWSYDQLSEEERRLFCLLSAFAGGWTMEAATRVAWEGIDEFEVLELLGRLRDKSLVEMERVEDGSTRYALLETVRQYAQERLNETGDGDAARTRHLDFYIALAEEANPKLLGPEQGAWLARLDRELENLLSAHAWCDRAEGGGERGLRLLGAARGYWARRGLSELGLRVTREALGRDGAQGQTAARARALSGAGVLAYWQGLYAEARGYFEESVSIWRVREDSGGVARALTQLADVAMAQGDGAGAKAHLEDALALARKMRDELSLAGVLNGLAELHRLDGDLDRAAPLYEESLALHRKRGDGGHIAVSLLNLAMVSIPRGDLDSARERLAEAARLTEETGSKQRGQAALDVSAALASALGDTTRAARVWGASEAAREKMGIQREPGDARFALSWIARAREALGEAAFGVAESAGRALSYEEALSETRAWLEGRESGTG